MKDLFVFGDIFKSRADVLVNPVNTVGVMGKGLALQFKNKYPDAYLKYVRLCKSGQLKIGNPIVVYDDVKHQHILLFPTKHHWRNPSSYDYIRDGLLYFKTYVYNPTLMYAFPLLGTGLGSLNSDYVKQLMIYYLEDTDNIKIYILR